MGSYACGITRDGDGRLETFTFPTLLDPDRGAGSPIGHVTYRSQATGDSVSVEGRLRPLYQVVREQDDGAGAVASGTWAGQPDAYHLAQMLLLDGRPVRGSIAAALR